MARKPPRPKCNKCKKPFTRIGKSTRVRCYKCVPIKPSYTPTLEQIQASCQEVHEGAVDGKVWDDDTKMRRMGMVVGDVELTVLDLGPVRKQSTVGGRE